MKRLSKQNFDDLIRNRFEGFEQAPPEHLRSKIKQSVGSNASAGNSLVNTLAGNKWLLSGIALVVVSGIVTLGILGFQSEKADFIAENGELLNVIEPVATERLVSDEINYTETNKVEQDEIKLEEKVPVITVQEDEKVSRLKDNEILVRSKEPAVINLKSDAGNDISVCGLECQLAAFLSNESITGEWSFTGPGNISFSSKSDPKSKIEATKYGVYELTWTERYMDQQSNDIISVNFHKAGDITITTDVIDATCHNANGSVDVYAEGGDGNYTYYWNDEPAQGESYRDNLTAGSYQIIVEDGDNCKATETITVSDVGNVTPAFVHKELTLSVDVPIYFINSTKVDGINYKSISACTFLWKFGDGNVADGDEPEHIYQIPGKYEIKMYATSPEGCLDSTYTIVIIDNEDIQYPNVFTPNGDGHADIFYVNVKYLEEFKCVIVNRYGKEIYKWNDPEKGWDGKLKDGSYANEGVYYYLVSGKDKEGKSYNYQSFFHLFK